MAIYLKKFETMSQYNAYTADTANFILPNVSLITENNKVEYNPYTPSIRVSGVSLNKNVLELNTEATEILVATVIPNDADDKSVTWSTSNNGVATVSQSGLVTAVATGSCTITVTTTDGGFTAQCNTTVTLAPQPNNVITYTASRQVYPYDETAFSGSSGQLTITSHTFENGVGTIEFDGNITSIGATAFHNCSGLTSIDIPDSVTRIGNSAFYGCSGLTSIDIPSSVTYIGDEVFYNCSEYFSLYIYNEESVIGSYYTVNGYSECPCESEDSCTISIYVPSSLVEDYKSSWDNYCNAIYSL